jgi:enamine deaminase RidA (YjgF/YER057c/UK114 family)
MEELKMKRINPENVWKPSGFVHATINGTLLITAGQTGRDITGTIVSDSFGDQARQALKNVKNIVESQGKSLDDVMKLTLYVKDLRYQKEFIQILNEFFSPEKRPAITLVGITGLGDERQLVEVEAIVDLSQFCQV